MNIIFNSENSLGNLTYSDTRTYYIQTRTHTHTTYLHTHTKKKHTLTHTHALESEKRQRGLKVRDVNY